MQNAQQYGSWDPTSQLPSPTLQYAAVPVEGANSEEVVVWDGRIARLRRPFVPSRQGSALPDFDLAHSPRSLQTASRRGWHADPFDRKGSHDSSSTTVRDSPRPSVVAQRAADYARSHQRGASARCLVASPRRIAPASHDAPWLAPEQRDILAYTGERMRDTKQRLSVSAKRTTAVRLGATQPRPWHDSSNYLRMALPKLRAMSTDVTIDDIMVDQITRLQEFDQVTRLRELRSF